jgi:c-di-GMP-binding flagellar brake protein YcgR
MMEEKKMKERRQYKRTDITIDVEYNMSRQQSWFEAGTRNISCRGICLITRASLLPGSVLHLRFKLPDSSRRIDVTGRVIWEDYVIENDHYIIGIQFTEINQSDIELIGKFVDNATFEM